ncbi:hypothetical protein C5167_028289 [Papaver somniferum]|uniref:uncharacterized protein LOC113331973 n=1 Tax=Papaver somniferum TaxID=3469 RepID=UPI000E6FE63C|nr:uncharacterized protein LOC113331973 [Papaver somniferum]XP_026434407.1 uncharacterized protein LOC113331973 [Papaver somniferum]RZC87835.1 hypothetical protein C5167_028289 [Papaver somniferum]
MNQISKLSVCRSLLRRNPFTRWSSKPLSSSLISNSPTSSNLVTIISKFHHTFNYPPQIFSIPGNNLRKFSGDAAAEHNFSANDLEMEIFDMNSAVSDARDDIELASLPPLDAVKILAVKYKAFIEKWGLHSVKDEDFPHYLQKFRREIEILEDDVEKLVAFGEYVAAGKPNGKRCWYEFKRWYDVAVMYGIELPPYSENESDTLPTAQDHIAVADNTNQEVSGSEIELGAIIEQREIELGAIIEQRELQHWNYKMSQAEGNSLSPL